MYLYGASGHAKVIIDILRANNENVEALFDDNEAIHSLLGYPVLCSSEVRGPLIISIGSNSIRKKIAESLNVTFGKAFHPSAIISEESEISEGTVVMQGAIIQSDVCISPHCTLCGNVSVGEGTWIGAGSTIIPGVKIGKWSVIGAGSVVTKDIPDNVLAAGNRCRIIKSL